LTICSESSVHFIAVPPALICGAGPAVFFGQITYSRSLAGDAGVALIDLGIDLIREILAYFRDAFFGDRFQVLTSVMPLAFTGPIIWIPR